MLCHMMCSEPQSLEELQQLLGPQKPQVASPKPSCSPSQAMAEAALAPQPVHLTQSHGVQLLFQQQKQQVQA